MFTCLILKHCLAYTLLAVPHHNLMHKFIPSFSLKATVTKPRSSSSSSFRVVIPCLSSAALQDGSYQPGRAYHSTHDDRRDFRAARALWGIEGRWSLQQLAAREAIHQELFPDLGESSYENWDYQQHDALQAFMDQRQLAAPSEPRHIWKLDGRLPPIWDLLDCAQPQGPGASRCPHQCPYHHRGQLGGEDPIA